MRLNLAARLASFAVIAGLLSASASASIVRSHTPTQPAVINGPHMVFFHVASRMNPGKIPAACQNPSFPLVCVSKKTPGQLGIEINCGSTICPPSLVFTWTSTVTNGKGKPTHIVATFDPNPGNPVVETLTIKTKAKPGTKYSQAGMACDQNGSCASIVGQVIVYRQ